MKRLFASACAAALLISTGAQAQAGAPALPRPLPPIPAAQAIDYPGVIRLEVDATDVARRIHTVRQTIPVSGPGPLTLLYPQWLPGKHAPRGPIEEIGGLTVTAGSQTLPWVRDTVNVFAFHVEVPAGVDQIEVRFQRLSPTAGNQGRVVVTPEMQNIQWETVLLYPAGYHHRGIVIDPAIRLPEGWGFGVALDVETEAGGLVDFAPVTLEVLQDSPMFAGRHFRQVDLDPGGRSPVRLNIVADAPHQLEITDEQLRIHRNLVVQADRLFGARHFDRYEFLLALTDRLGGIGLEHHRSSENSVAPGYFTNWDGLQGDRSLLPHEYTHSWVGKFRRPADQMTLNFEEPLQDSLLWVYEGADMYFGALLQGRAGFNTTEEMLAELALTAATYDTRVGRDWRPLQDTTNDPIVAARTPQPWRSWSRSEDYYSEGLLVWLEADMLIREATRERRSLDDFARAFFGMDDGVWSPRPFTFEEVVQTLNAVHPHDWAGFLRERLDRTGGGAPLEGLTRGGWRLVYADERTDYQKALDSEYRRTDLTWSLGLMTSSSNQITAVQWGGPAFEAGLTVGTEILAINGMAASGEGLTRAVTEARDRRRPIELITRHGDHYRTVQIAYYDGLRYPRLERIEGVPDRLSRIFAPRTR